MNKFKSISLIIIFFIFISYNLYSDCPEGFTEHTTNQIYSYGENFVCHVTISYCCKWDNNAKEVITEINWVKTTYDNECMRYLPDVSDFVNWLHVAITNDAENLCTPPYPDCEDEENPYYVLTINIERCWKYVNVIRYIGDDIYTTMLVPCKGTGVFCQTVWKICLDYNVPPPQEPILKITFVSKSPVGSPGCLTEEPTLPPEGKGFDEAWETYCFETTCQ